MKYPDRIIKDGMKRILDSWDKSRKIIDKIENTKPEDARVIKFKITNK